MKNNLINNIIGNYNSCLRKLMSNNLISKHFDLIKAESGKGTIVTWKTKRNDYRNISYDITISTEEIRKDLIENNQYCLQFYDGSLFSYEAVIEKGKIKKANIVFIKCYDVVNDEDSKTWQDYQFDDGEDTKLGTPVFFRIDIDETSKKENHSVCHLTLSNYKYCRIPLLRKISIQEILTFILNNFYGIYNIDLPKFSLENCMEESEKNKIHLSWKD